MVYLGPSYPRRGHFWKNQCLQCFFPKKLTYQCFFSISIFSKINFSIIFSISIFSKCNLSIFFQCFVPPKCNLSIFFRFFNLPKYDYSIIFSIFFRFFFSMFFLVTTPLSQKLLKSACQIAPPPLFPHDALKKIVVSNFCEHD